MVRWTVSPSEERTLTAVTQEKHLLFLCFDLFCRFFWIFFPFYSPFVVVVDFIGTMKSKLLTFFFPPPQVTVLLLLYYKPLPLCRAFAVLGVFFSPIF